MILVDGGIESGSLRVEGLDHGGQLLRHFRRDVVDGAFDGRVGDVNSTIVGGVVDQGFPLFVSLRNQAKVGDKLLLGQRLIASLISNPR